jgi:hypothetical protein
MINFDNLDDVLKELETAQDNENDERERAREAKIFVTKKNGQWEQRVWQQLGDQGRPRYTYDRITPILDAVVGELEQNEFAAVVSPAGGQATKDTASLLDSLVRSIQGWSGAKFTYKKVARNMTTQGFDCCRVIHDHRDSDSFDQDLIVKYIPNSIDRVWFDPNSEEQDRSDANFCWVLQGLTKEQYEEKWPKGKGEGVPSNKNHNFYFNKRELVVVGELLFKKRTKKIIVQMNNGAVYNKEEVEPVLDELAAAGVTVVKERETDDITVFSRIFDGTDWLEEEKETVFSLLPIAPFYNSFEIIDDKITWRRPVEQVMDPQRVFNYAVSRQIEEGALAPRPKILMTNAQAEGHEDQIQKLNTSPDPVLFYNFDESAPPPYTLGGPQDNPSLRATASEAAQSIESAMGMFAANLAKNPGLQSGKAIELQQNKGDTGNVSIYVDISIGITYLCKVLLDGAPKVYDTRRDVALLNADGSVEVKTLNDQIRDEQTNQVISVNNLEGNHTVTCSMGPMFRNKMEEANAALLDLAAVLPGILEGSADIFTRNITAPGMDQVAERVRRNLFDAGAIPFDQMTEEEKQELQQKQQEALQQAQQGDPVQEQALKTLAAQEQESNAKAQTAASKGQSDQVNAQAKMLAEVNKGREQDRKDAQMQQEQTRKDIETQNQEIKIMAETLKIIREAMGVDSIVGPHAMDSFIEQAATLQEAIPSEASEIIEETRDTLL